MSVLFVDKVTVKIPYQKNPILKNINFSIEQGEFIVLLGHNGSGKSTLLKILSGEMAFSSGRILLHKMPLKKLTTLKKAREFISLSQRTEERLFLELTLRENIRLWESRFPKKDRLNTPQILALTPKPARFVSLLDQQVSTLSGGEKQAFLLALALAHPPEILFLDEHTSALDPKASQEIMSLTHQSIKTHRITTIMVTHRLEDALTYGTRLIVLKEGQIVIDEKDKTSLNLLKIKKMLDF